MPSKPFIISIRQPCQENWHEMPKEGQGRQCMNCCKTVIDFTVLTDKEVIEIFVAAKDAPPCGRFLESQLNRELIYPPVTKPFYVSLIRKLAASLLLWQSVVSVAFSQTVKPKTEQQPTAPDTTAKQPQASQLTAPTAVPMSHMKPIYDQPHLMGIPPMRPQEFLKIYKGVKPAKKRVHHRK